MEIEKENAEHICADCRRHIDDYQLYQGYSDQVRRECLKMYVNGMGFWGIERVTSRLAHRARLPIFKAVGNLLPDAYERETTPSVGELDQARNLCPLKKN